MDTKQDSVIETRSSVIEAQAVGTLTVTPAGRYLHIAYGTADKRAAIYLTPAAARRHALALLALAEVLEQERP